jgi:hypothetical protein
LPVNTAARGKLRYEHFFAGLGCLVTYCLQCSGDRPSCSRCAYGRRKCVYPETDRQSRSSPEPQQSSRRATLCDSSASSLSSTPDLPAHYTASSDDHDAKGEHEAIGPYLLYDMQSEEMQVWDTNPGASSPDSGYGSSPGSTYTEVDYCDGAGSQCGYAVDASVPYLLERPPAPAPILAPQPVRASTAALESRYGGHELAPPPANPAYRAYDRLPARTVGPAAARVASAAGSEPINVAPQEHLVAMGNSADDVDLTSVP